MKKKCFFCIFLSAIIFISGCNNNSYSDNSSIKAKESKNIKFKKRITSTANRDIMPGTENLKGIRYRIYNNKGELDNQYNYYLNTGQTWDKFISISNMIEQSSTYKLLLFIDSTFAGQKR